MTFRMPLISRPSQARKPDSMMARTFVSAGLALLTAVALPVGDVAHSAGMDAGRPKVRYVDKSWVKQTNLPLLTFVQQPNGKAVGLELPKILLRKGFRDTGWTQNTAVLNTIVVSPQPFGLYDWPLPKKARIDLADNAPEVSLSLQYPPNPVPEVLISRPFGRLMPLPPATPYVNLVPLETAASVGIPRHLTEWPLSVRRKATAPEPATINVAATRTVVVATKPFAQLDWAIPKILRDNRQARITPLRDGSIFDVTPVVTYNLATTDTPDTAFFSLAFWRPKLVNPDIWIPIPVRGSSLGGVLTEDTSNIDAEDGTIIILNALTTDLLLTELAIEIDTEGGQSILSTRDDPGGGNLLWTPKTAGSSIWRKV